MGVAYFNLLATLSSFCAIDTMSKNSINLIYDYLAEDLRQVQSLIEKYCQCSLPEASGVLELVKARNGKMIRPILVLLSGKAYGSLVKDHYISAALIEMVHVASLLHDDVLDGADTRRHQPSLNKLVGNKAAVLAGDLLLSIVLATTFELENQRDFGSVAKVVGHICEGELAQQRTSGNFSLSEEQYLDIVSKKTASLIACCVERGAFLAGAGPEQCQRAFEIGRDFGIAFQVMDDLRDIISPEVESGKTVGTDIILGKNTLPVIHHIAIAGDNTLGWLNEISGSGFTLELKQELIARLNATDSIDYCKEKVRKLSQGLRSFVESIDDSGLRQSFETLIDAVVSL